MERVTRIFLNEISVLKLSHKFSDLGVELKSKNPKIGAVILVKESHPNFASIVKLAKDNELSLLVEAQFTASDYRQASHFTLFGMPKTFPCPTSYFWEKTTTYESNSRCRQCGAGARQVAPFRFEREVKLKELEVIGLHWIFDEIFVGASLISAVFSKFGLQTREVLNCKGNKCLTGIRQLIVPDLYASIDTKGLKSSTCPLCSREKYERPKDFFPRLTEAIEAPIFKTRQYFGSGGEAYRQIIINKELYNALVEAGAKSTIIDPLAR